MKFFTRFSLIAAVGLTTLGPISAAPVTDAKVRLENFRYKGSSKTGFMQKEAAAQFSPDMTFGPANVTGDLDAPGGKRWFYTGEYRYEVIPADHEAGIYYDKEILRHYKFRFYDENCTLLGTVESDMNYQEDEDKVALIEVAPVATRHFFNTNDAVEVMIALSINTIQPGTNHYRSLVYSMESADKTATEPIRTIDAMLGDAVEGEAADSKGDKFYMVFATDTDPYDLVEDGEITFWEYLTTVGINLEFYGPATNDTDGPTLIGTKQLPLVQLPGDQEGTPYLLSYVHDGQATYMYSYLEEPIWEPYDDPIFGEIVQRDNNKLHIEFYEPAAKGLEMVHQCTVDVVKDQDDQTAIASFFSVGDMNYDGDLLYGAPGAGPNAPWMVVTRSNYNPASDKSSNSYFLYDQEGRKICDLALYCDSSVGLTDIPGFEPQQMFINLDAGYYMFRFVDLYSGKEQWKTTNYYDFPDGEYESIMANLDRTPYGDSYRYAAELSAPEEAANGDCHVRVLWMDEKGKYVRLDNINAGRDVMYASVYIDGPALQPGAFYDDDVQEYLYLVKRGVPGSVLSEELLISQPVSEELPEGRDLLHLGADDRGALSSIIPILGGEDPELIVYYYQSGSQADGRYTQDIYALPLGGMNAVEVMRDKMPGVTVDGSVINAEGAVKVYTLTGALAGEGNGSFDLSTLSEGIYIIVNDGKSLKIQVK